MRVLFLRLSPDIKSDSITTAAGFWSRHTLDTVNVAHEHGVVKGIEDACAKVAADKPDVVVLADKAKHIQMTRYAVRRLTESNFRGPIFYAANYEPGKMPDKVQPLTLNDDLSIDAAPLVDFLDPPPSEPAPGKPKAARRPRLRHTKTL